jgi:hypothetical protein
MLQVPVIAKRTFIPSLAFAGFVSAIFTAGFWWASILAANHSKVLYAMLGSISFGLALGAHAAVRLREYIEIPVEGFLS